MKFGKIAIAALACALCLTSANLVSAAPGDGARQSRNWSQQYTPEQMDTARKLANDHYAAMEQTRQALSDRQYELDRELASPNPDKGKIEALSQEVGKLRGQMLSARADLRNNLAAQGLPPDYFGYGYGHGYHRGMGPGWGAGYGDCMGPCWGGAGYGDYRGGWYHHGRGHGRGGCWR